MFNLVLLLLKYIFLGLLYLFLLFIVVVIYKDISTKSLRARLIVLEGATEIGTVFPLGNGLTIGRSPDNDIVLANSFVSHIHARVLEKNGAYFIEDLNSTNGTFLREKRISKPAQLKSGDRIRIGKTLLEFVE
ncbi:MAG: FHA domain-containing protein [Actinomycetota bacterium]|nr:FHA domain-containing protein [Actinomycetota bacterium]